MTTMWKADHALLMETKDTFLEILEALEGVHPTPEDRSTLALEALECIGTLLYMDCLVHATDMVGEQKPTLAEYARDTLFALDGSKLDSSIAEILQVAPKLAERDGSDVEVYVEQIVEALRARDEIELVLAGARHLLGDEYEIPIDLESSILAFDELLDEELWRLLPLGDRRTAHHAWAAPRFRTKLWWWSRGSELPATILDSLGDVARLLHLFPQTKGELDALIRAEGTLAEIIKKSPQSTTTLASLERFRQRRGSDTAPSEALAAAAATTREQVILQDSELTITLLEDALVVDLSSDAELLAGQLPTLETDAHPSLPATTDDEIPGEYRFPLGAEQLDALETRLRVPLTTSEVLIDLHDVITHDQ